MKGEINRIWITQKLYNELLADSEFLARLRDAGVDNWEGYKEVKG